MTQVLELQFETSPGKTCVSQKMVFAVDAAKTIFKKGGIVYGTMVEYGVRYRLSNFGVVLFATPCRSKIRRHSRRSLGVKVKSYFTNMYESCHEENLSSLTLFDTMKIV